MLAALLLALACAPAVHSENVEEACHASNATGEACQASSTSSAAMLQQRSTSETVGDISEDETEGGTCYGQLQGGMAVDEGNGVGDKPTNDLNACKRYCTAKGSCKSATFCARWWGCWMKDKSMSGTEATQTKGDCVTLYKKPCSGGPAPTPMPTPTDDCYGQLQGGMAVVEGNGVGDKATNDLNACKRYCTEKGSCKSATFCAGWWPGCWMKDKGMSGTEATKRHGHCVTIYKKPACGGGVAPTPMPAPPCLTCTKFKVISYNLFWWNAFERNYNTKGKKVIANIKSLKPDLIGIQEVGDPSLIKRETGLLPASKFDGGQGVFVKEELFDVGESGSMDIKATGRWGTRYVTWAQLTHKGTRRAFWHFNTHWCVANGNYHGKWRTCNEWTRYGGAKNMMKLIKEKIGSQPALITGDFNAKDWERGPKHILSEGFSVGQWNYVDAVYYSTAHWKKTDSSVGEAEGSDHRPVICELELK